MRRSQRSKPKTNDVSITDKEVISTTLKCSKYFSPKKLNKQDVPGMEVFEISDNYMENIGVRITSLSDGSGSSDDEPCIQNKPHQVAISTSNLHADISSNLHADISSNLHSDISSTAQSDIVCKNIKASNNDTKVVTSKIEVDGTIFQNSSQSETFAKKLCTKKLKDSHPLNHDFKQGRDKDFKQGGGKDFKQGRDKDFKQGGGKDFNSESCYFSEATDKPKSSLCSKSSAQDDVACKSRQGRGKRVRKGKVDKKLVPPDQVNMSDLNINIPEKSSTSKTLDCKSSKGKKKVLSKTKQNSQLGKVIKGRKQRNQVLNSSNSGRRGDESDSSSNSDWEEVTDLPIKNQIPDKPVQITVAAPDIMKKKKKNKSDIQAYFEREFNRVRKELREEIHKVHLLCLLASGMVHNRVYCDELLMSVALSCCPGNFVEKNPSTWTVKSLKSLISWFNESYNCERISPSSSAAVPIVDNVVKCWTFDEVPKHNELLCMLTSLLHSLHLSVRIICLLRPLSHKLEKTKASVDKLKTPEAASELSQTKSTDDLKQSPDIKDRPTELLIDIEKETGSKMTSSKLSSKLLSSASTKPASSTQKRSKIPSTSKQTSKTTQKSRDTSAVRKSTRKVSDKRMFPEKKSCDDQSDSKCNFDSDFEVIEVKLKTPARKLAAKSTNRLVLSSESSNSSVDFVGKGKGVKMCSQDIELWLEVYLERENKWLCISLPFNSISSSCDVHLHVDRLPDLVLNHCFYIVGMDADSSVKDLTLRYVSSSHWLSVLRKLHVDTDWWKETLHPYRLMDNSARANKEDAQLQAKLLNAPLPTKVSDYKNHPLYALKRHLLKFEAIYPDSSIPVGYNRGEAVYSRDCVHELHARVQWLKEARVVRIGEKPYKFVKARKSKKRAFEDNKELQLELFGLWQTEPYIPPLVVDGKVPRNEFGNVELFKPCMLPIGTVHLRLPGLNKIAKQLDIDCVPAMTGWDFHSGWTHPVMDGFIVCEEHKDVLIASWDEEQEILKEKEKEKKQKKVLSNWKLLVKGILIRDHLRRKYDLSQGESSEPVKKKSKKGELESVEATDVVNSWPSLRQKESKEFELSKAHNFPFEKL